MYLFYFRDRQSSHTEQPEQLDKAQEPHGTKKLEFLDIIVPVTPEQNGEEIERDGGDEVDCEPSAEVVLRHLVVVG